MNRAISAVRLGWLTGRAIVHALLTEHEIGEYCRDCNSSMHRANDGVITVVSSGKDCPVHAAWRELSQVGRKR